MANGKPLSQKACDFILDIIDAYIDIVEALCFEYEENPSLFDNASSGVKRILDKFAKKQQNE